MGGALRRIGLREAEGEKEEGARGPVASPSVERPGYIVHGLPVRSDFPLPLAQAANGMQPHGEVVRRGRAPVPVPDEPPPGESYGAVGTPPAKSWWSLDG